MPPQTSRQLPSTRLPYMPGLDGLRAIAVVAVLLYHGQDVSGIASFLKPQGGFLGVEMFFVISGFLITALLLHEHERTERIDLRAFWVRRARRLLPALYLFLVATVALAALFATDAFDKIRREIVGAVFYFSNWLLIALDESYFEASGRPSLFRHLWSLAIEEQFYLVWPLIVLAGLRWGGRYVLLALTLAGVAGSTALMWLLFDGIEQYGDVTSVYFRTDARAAALLVGSALALVWRPWRGAMPQRRTTRRFIRRWALEAAGLAALVLVIAMQYFFTDRIIEWQSYERLYHAGFLALSAATMVVIAAVATPGSRLGWALGNPLFRWIGTRSYGIYLWHWPVFQLTRPRLDVSIDGYALLGIRLLLTLALVELSYQLVEVPVRQRRFVRSFRQVVQTPRGIVLGSLGALALIGATAIVAVSLPTIDRTGPTESAIATIALTTDDDDAESATTADTEADEVAAEATPTPLVEPGPTPSASPAPTAVAEAAELVDGDFEPVEPTPEPTPTQPPLPPPPPLSAPFDIGTSRIHIVGDSVIEGAQSQLYRISPGVTVDGRIGRQWWEVEGELRQMRAQGLGNDVVIIQLGNNGNFSRQMFDGVMNALSGTRLVLFINIHAPVLWEAEVNAALRGNVNRYAENARLIDWYTTSQEHPEFFIEDGTHLQGAGMVAFRRLIENALLSLS